MLPSSFIASGLLSCLCFSSLSLALPQNGEEFSAVDLGYAVHIPTKVSNTTSGIQYADYKNIRFAQPPLGDLRFRKPAVPPPTEDEVQDGSAGLFETSCVSVYTDQNKTWGQEDCLYLNVRVPEGVKEGDNVPVLHWLYGSGYALGTKDLSGDALGVYEDMYGEDQKFIFVASNYRMGLYGWTASLTDDTDANAGLHDGVVALEWTKKYISKFGGDPDQITAMGESAGAGLITLMLVSNGGEGTLPFNKAFVSSPGYLPQRDPARPQAVYQEVLKAAECDSIACVRDTTEADLFEVNKHMIISLTPPGVGGEAVGPGLGFTPVVDGEYIQDLPYVLYKEGRYHKEVEQVISGNLINEGTTTAPEDPMPDYFPEYVRAVAPGVNDTTIELIQSLYEYPPDMPERLAWDFTTDMVFACNAYNAAKAYSCDAQRYTMSIPPATHGLDQSYFFFYDNTTTPVESIPLAREFQERLRRFITGAENPEKFPDLEEWPTYGDDETSFDFTLDGFKVVQDPWEVHGRCNILNEIWADPANGV